MKCPECHSDNREGVKFCEECGAKVAIICARCKSRIPIDKKFCGECGERLREEEPAPAIDYDKPQSYTPKFMAEKILTTRSSLEGERKLVTVFFSDVAGFTSLSEQLDPEAVHQIMDGCFKILMEEIHKYEGTINQFTGDGVMALFGAPLAHEDHAQRACFAALAIQNSLDSYGKKIEKEFGLDFNMRIGLNSGPVVVGAIGDDLRMDYTAVGDTTNLAARMESMAKPGEILLSENTYRLVKRYFKFKNLGTVPIKGKKALQAVYQLTGISGVKSRLDASEARGLTNFIGRREEINSLLDVYKRTEQGKGHVVGIVGEAGVGKSRFVFEMHNRIGDPGHWLESRCIQYGRNIPFFPIRELARSYFNIRDGASDEEITEQLKSGLLYLDKDLIPSLPALRDFFSLPATDRRWEHLDPEEKRIKIFEAIRNFLNRLGKDDPLILIIDDLQWIDKTSEEFINYFIEWIANTKILLLLAYRHEYNHSWGSKSFYSQIGIFQLSDEESRQLLGLILGDGEITPELEELILGRTSGNPLFIEELTHTLIENGTIKKTGGRYQLSQKMSQVQVPDTIQGIIAGRMDRLEDDIKRTMQIASVIGRNFALKILQTITGLRDELKAYLLTLQGLEFIYEKNLFPELEYIFKNAVTREVAYNSLLLNRRKEIHARIGGAIEQTYAPRLEEFYEVIAYHYEKSDNHEGAFRYLKLSGDKATRNNSAWEAFEFYKSAMKILKRLTESAEQKQRQLEVIHAMMTPMIVLGFPEESLDILNKGTELAEELDDRKSLIRFYSNTGLYHASKGKHREGINFSRKAYEEAAAIGDITSMAQTAPDLCLLNLSLGNYSEVIDISSRMIQAIQNAGREKDNFGGPAVVLPSFLAMSGYAKANVGQFDEGMSQCLEGLEASSKTENIFTKTICNIYPARSMLLQGHWKKAKEYYLISLEYLDQAPFISIETIIKSGLGVAETFLGDPEKGIRLAEESLSLFLDAGMEGQRSNLLFSLGICLYEAGQLKKALLSINDALEAATKNNEMDIKGKALIWKGRITENLSDEPQEQAVKDIMEGLEILSLLKARPDIPIGHLFLGELYRGRSQPDPALIHLNEAERLFDSMGMTYWIEETKKTIHILSPKTIS